MKRNARLTKDADSRDKRTKGAADEGHGFGHGAGRYESDIGAVRKLITDAQWQLADGSAPQATLQI